MVATYPDLHAGQNVVNKVSWLAILICMFTVAAPERYATDTRL